MKKENEKPDIEFYNSFTNELQTKVNCKVISTFSDYIYDESLFYNTALHLINEGAKKRTEQLCIDLEKYFLNN